MTPETDHDYFYEGPFMAEAEAMNQRDALAMEHQVGVSDRYEAPLYEGNESVPFEYVDVESSSLMGSHVQDFVTERGIPRDEYETFMPATSYEELEYAAGYGSAGYGSLEGREQCDSYGWFDREFYLPEQYTQVHFLNEQDPTGIAWQRDCPMQAPLPLDDRVYEEVGPIWNAPSVLDEDFNERHVRFG